MVKPQGTWLKMTCSTWLGHVGYTHIHTHTHKQAEYRCNQNETCKHLKSVWGTAKRNLLTKRNGGFLHCTTVQLYQGAWSRSTDVITCYNLVTVWKPGKRVRLANPAPWKKHRPCGTVQMKQLWSRLFTGFFPMPLIEFTPLGKHEFISEGATLWSPWRSPLSPKMAVW